MNFEMTETLDQPGAALAVATGAVIRLNGNLDELLKQAAEANSGAQSEEEFEGQSEEHCAEQYNAQPEQAEQQTELEALLDMKSGGSLSITELQNYIAGWRPEVQVEIDRRHKNLYQLNQKPYEFAWRIACESNSVISDAMKLALQNELIRAGIIKKAAKTMTAKAIISAAVKLSFGVERRLVHRYTKVNSFAFLLGVRPCDLPRWIEAEGGVEKIRRSTVVNGVLVSEEKRLAELREKVAEEKAKVRKNEDDLLAANVIARFPSDGLQCHVEGIGNHQFALLVTMTADKQLTVHGVVKPDAEGVLQKVRHAAYAANKLWLEREPMPPVCEQPNGQQGSN